MGCVTQDVLLGPKQSGNILWYLQLRYRIGGKRDIPQFPLKQ